MSSLKEVLIGRPLAEYEEHEQRLTKRVGLAVFASDAISSTAYATEEILHILVPVAAMAALNYLVPISILVMIVLAIVITSYRQTIHAYPNAGGSYVVALDNLGETIGLLAGSALLIDYTLTVAVSVSAGVAAVTSAFESLLPYKVPIALGVVAFMTYANLRGAKESGRIFAIPTYGYILGLILLCGYGLFRVYVTHLPEMPLNEEKLLEMTHGHPETLGLAGFAGWYMLARAFSSGAVALTGTEAIANGVQAFRPPEARNAARTLLAMGFVLGGFFFLISVLAHHLKPLPLEQETLLSQMGGYLFGRTSILYYYIQFVTMAILFLAANTAYADFPRLSSFMAGDGYMPRQFANRGDRLVYSNGIFAVAVIAGILLTVFKGSTTALIPLYAVGVFTAFTCSQSGMVARHLRLREEGWRRSVVVNGVGAVATGIVLIVVLVSKFTTGAWIPFAVIPVIMLFCRGVHRHYVRVQNTLRVDPGWRPPRMQHTVIVLVSNVHRGVLRALSYARSLAPNYLTAVTVVSNDEHRERIEKQWEDFHVDVPLTIITSQYRELTRPILRFLDDLDDRWENDIITVIIPEFIVGKWWGHLLHNQSALVLKGRLLFRNNTVVTSVPTHLEE